MLTINAERPPASLTIGLGLAPAASNALTSSSRPSWAAIHSAVLPTPSAALTSAPALSSALTVARSPFRDAAINSSDAALATRTKPVATISAAIRERARRVRTEFPAGGRDWRLLALGSYSRL